jgi:uncharacterized protein YecT (DUF1311 family)
MIALARLCAAALAIGLTPGLAPGAAADSIDGLCPDNPDRIERAICADPQLKANRDRMAATLQSARDALSDRGDEQLATAQAAWLKRAHLLCTIIVDPSLLELGEKARRCLAFEYYARNETLTHVTRKVGPFQFFAAERFEAGAATPKDTNYMCPGMICRDLRYPQIDSPATPATERWNAAMAAWAEQAYKTRTQSPPPGMTDLSVEALVVFADADFIGVVRGAIWSTEGSPRVSIDLERDHRWLASGKALAPGDVFDPAQDWAGALQQAATAQLAKQHPTVKIAETIARQAPDPTHWTLTADALTINLDQGVGKFSFAARIPWRDLQPYLVAPLPLALNLD